MSTYTIAGQVTFAGSGAGINGVTITVAYVSGTADPSAPYTFTTAGVGAAAGEFSGGTLVSGTTYSIVAHDGSLVFSTLPDVVVVTSNITGQNFTLTPTISVTPTTITLPGPASQTEQLTSVVANDVAGTTSWTSSNTAVATVSSSGLVTIIGPGSATITASVTDDTAIVASCTITVAATQQLFLNSTTINLLQNIIQEQIQTGYKDNPFTSQQSTDLKTALVALRSGL